MARKASQLESYAVELRTLRAFHSNLFHFGDGPTRTVSPEAGRLTFSRSLNAHAFSPNNHPRDRQLAVRLCVS
jgi:hypothetical protein